MKEMHFGISVLCKYNSFGTHVQPVAYTFQSYL
jgi:hypothetical protein